MSVSKGKKSEQDPLKIIAVVGMVLIIVGVGWYFLKPESGGPGETYSTFKAVSYTDGEDVSNFVELSIWTWDPDKTYGDEEDLRNINNFEEEIGSKDAEDISIDLTQYEYGVWIEVDNDGDSVFENNFHWLSTAQNVANYPIYCYHVSSDVNFNMLDESMDEIAANCSTDANYTISFDFPQFNSANSHSGDDWEVDDDDVDDYTEDELQYLYNEENWRCQAPVYVITADADDDYSKTFEKFTEVFAFKIQMNTTISTSDGNSAQINCTIDDQYSDLVYSQVSGQYLYLLFADAVTAPDSFMFELEFGDDICIDEQLVYSGRLAVTGDITTAGSFSAYSAVGA